MTEECRYKYLEPQVLMAGIVNEGRDMLSYVMQFLHVDRIAFCKRINEAILEINEISDEAPVLGEITSENKSIKATIPGHGVVVFKYIKK